MISRTLNAFKAGHFFVKWFLLFSAILVLLLASVYQWAPVQAEEKKYGKNAAGIETANVPDHEVRYKGVLSPVWKTNWDLARELYREKKYREALVQYEILLSQKDSIDEARWEYATLLLFQERWQQAGEHVEKLLANDPDNIDYLFAQTEIYANTGNIDPAIELYKKLCGITADTPVIARSLEGLIKVLEKKGEQKEVLSYLERLIALKPDQTELRIKRARLVIESGQYERAQVLLARLEKSLPDNLSVLHLQAGLQEKLGNRDAEAECRQKIVLLNPDDLQTHAMLQQYYRDKENWAMSRMHLEVLLKNTPDNVAILEESAELNIKLGRMDRALEDYGYLLALNPYNEAILQKKKAAQKALAEDLVVLVEHNGSQKLWQDLVQVTSDRTGIYREIAALLRKKGYTDKLAEVLTLICLEDPYDEKNLAELAGLLKEKGRNDELKELLEQVLLKKQMQ